jgi:acyl-CoA thioester hydrolase
LLHTMDVDVNIFDTDCFGVMWHGASTKWLEIGRVKFLELQGIKLSMPGEPGGYIYPVVEQNFKFKSPAHYGDTLTLSTRLAIEGHKFYFYQAFKSQATGKVTVEAVTTVVLLDGNWKVQRRIPEFMQKALGLTSSEN